MSCIFSKEIFNPAFVLEGPHLVAASAGTGKTYNIQNIYARLVAEKGFRTSQIQVMTFTEKATKELRDRVRKVLADLSRLFAGDVAGFKPEELERLEKLRACARATIGGESPDAVARMRIDLALMEFDQAAISTIHGFCRRALVRFAFETDSAFKTEFADTKAQDLARRVRDWWRCNRASIPDAVKDGVDIGMIQSYVSGLAGKTGWNVDHGPDDDAGAYALARAEEIVNAYEADRPTRTTQTYDDLLRSLSIALQDGEKGHVLAACLRNEFKAALVDEFQDTDPVQYEIFRRVFIDPTVQPAPALFFVGDPKQAIYSFRGGDIYTYKKAVTDPSVEANTYRLDKNFRSTPRLIDAVNALFMDENKGKDSYVRTFGDDSIGYSEKLHSDEKKEPLTLPDGTPDPSPFRIVMAENADGRSQAVVDTVLKVLEEQRENGITPKDIAILTTSNDAGVGFRDALWKVGVPAVLQRAGNVFAGQMAGDFRQVLMAMAQMGGRGQVRAALLTGFFSFDKAMLDDEYLLADMVGFFGELNQIWLARGFNAALAALEAKKECDFRRKLAGQPDGERLLADLMQIIDLADAAVKELGPAPETLVDWLTERINQSGDEADVEEYARQLESESDALKTMTIHVSKGLEFPIVIVPMTKGWDVQPPYFYHDANMDLHVALDDEAHAKAAAEHDAERMRLLYVALTRATKRTILVTTEPNPESPLGRLFANARRNGAGEDAQGAPIMWTVYEQQEEPLPPYSVSDSGVKAEDLLPAKVSRHYSTVPTKGSYSSLAPGAHGGHDDEFDFDSAAMDGVNENAEGVMALPGGTKTGTCWHEILERLPFDADDDAILAETRRALSVHGLASPSDEAFAKDAGLVAEMVKSALECPLRAPDGTSFSLREIGGQDRFSEWEFDFSSAASASTTAAIAEILRDEWKGEVSKRAFLKEIEGWNRPIPKGYLRGFLDLVFRKDGYYYVVDWKSNSLTRHVADFMEEGITAEMASAGYFFQYLMYSAVLHRVLKETMGADYSWERNFGGIRYYFLRGIPFNGEKAVFCDRPGEALLDKLCTALGLEG